MGHVEASWLVQLTSDKWPVLSPGQERFVLFCWQDTLLWAFLSPPRGIMRASEFNTGGGGGEWTSVPDRCA